MADERQIASVVWHQVSEQVEVIYAEGDPDLIFGAQIVAADLAKKAGLRLISSEGGTFRWTLDPDTWWSP